MYPHTKIEWQMPRFTLRFRYARAERVNKAIVSGAHVFVSIRNSAPQVSFCPIESDCGSDVPNGDFGQYLQCRSPTAHPALDL